MSNIQKIPFDRRVMLDVIGALDEPFDVIVIGGGATGVYTALEAAARGLRTALFERHDFASGTSSKSTKLIHGGIRYLQQGRLGLVRESLAERRILMSNAPHLVNALPMVVPAYSRWQKLKYTAGVMAYDALSRGYRLGSTKRLSHHDVLRSVPEITEEGLRGGAGYLDGQTDDARLALTVARTAAEYGAVVVNYMSVEGLLVNRGRISGVEVRNTVSGEELAVNARVVINSTGVYSDETTQLSPEGATGLMRWSRGTHIVLGGELLDGGNGLLVPETRDGRVIYALPWLGATLVGTTDVPVASPDADPSPPQEDVDFLLGELFRYIPAARGERVLSAFTGIRPLVSKSKSSETAALSRTHRVVIGESGLVTVMGGKWTTARLMAEDAVASAAQTAGLPYGGGSVTTSLRLSGYDLERRNRFTFAPVSNPDDLYGDHNSEITKLERRSPELARPLHRDLPYRLSHAVYAVRNEMAVTIEDVLARRTRSMFLNAEAANAVAGDVVEVVAQHCGLSHGWKNAQLSALPGILSEFSMARTL